MLLAGLAWWGWASLRAWRTGHGVQHAMPKLGSAILLLVFIASIFDYPARTPTMMAVIIIAAIWLSSAVEDHQRQLYEKMANIYSHPAPHAWNSLKRMLKLCNVLLLVVTLSACAGSTPPPVSGPNLTVVQDSSALPAPDRNDLTADDRPSLIGPLDTIQVDVFNVPDLSRELQVDASGRISMPLVGTIDARGKTAAELANAVEAALRVVMFEIRM